MLPRRSLTAVLGPFSLPLLLCAQAPPLPVAREIAFMNGGSTCLAWSVDGKRIAAGGSFGEVLLLDAESGRIEHQLSTGTQGGFADLAFAPDGSTLAVGAVGGGELFLWDARSGQRLHTLPGQFWSIRWSGDGSLLAGFTSAERGQQAVIIDARTGTVRHRLRQPGFEPGPRRPVPEALLLEFSPGSERLAVGNFEHTVLYDVATGAERHRIGAADWRAEEPLGALRRWSWDGWLWWYVREWDDAFGLGWVGDPQRLVLSRGTRGLRGHDSKGTFSLDASGPMMPASDGRRWLRAAEGSVQVYERDVLQRTLAVPLRAQPGQVVFANDGRYFAVRAGGGVRVFEGEDGSEVDLHGVALAGELFAAGPGCELGTWQPSVLVLQQEGPSRLAIWSIDQLRQGVPTPLRLYEFELPAESCSGSAPHISPDGRWFAALDMWCDLQHPERVERVEGANICQLLPDVGGDVLRLCVSGPAPVWSAGNRLSWRRGGEWAKSRHVDQSPNRVLRSPTGGSIAVVGGGLTILGAADLGERQPVAGDWYDADWVDEQRLLLLEGLPPRLPFAATPRPEPHGLALLRLGEDSPGTRWELPSAGTAVAADHRGRRAVVLLHDRALLLRLGE